MAKTTVDNNNRIGDWICFIVATKRQVAVFSDKDPAKVEAFAREIMAERAKKGLPSRAYRREILHPHTLQMRFGDPVEITLTPPSPPAR